MIFNITPEFVTQIGKKRELSDEEISIIFLISKDELSAKLSPYPKLNINNKLFTVFPLSKIENLEHFIIGLHLIELKYKELRKTNVGFGSPSQTYKFLEMFADIDYEKAKAIEQWIIETGGNYYIPKYTVSSSEQKKVIADKQKKLEEERKEQKRLAFVQKQKQYLENRTKLNEERKSERDTILKLEMQKILSMILEEKKSIFFFYDQLISRRNEIFSSDMNKELWNQIKLRNSHRTDKFYINLLYKIDLQQ